jgi:hypothetical protein
MGEFMRQLLLLVMFAVLGASLIFSTPAFAYDGKLRVKCNVPADVYINKIQVGKTGEIISELPFGRCRIWVVADGYKRHEQMVDIVGNDVIEVKVVLKREGDDSTDTDEEPSSDKEEPGEEEPKKEDKEKEKPEKFDIKEARKASKKEDNDRLRKILNSDSEYIVRITVAAALLRLKSKASVDFLDGEFSEKFKSAPDKWFNDSPLFGQSRMLAGSINIADAFDEKEVKFDTFEETVPGYAAVLVMKKKQEEYRKECRKLQKKMARLKKRKATGWWGQYSQCDYDIKRMSKDIKDYNAFISRILSILKKRLRSIEDKDLAALAKYFHDHAKGKLKD